MKIDGGGQAAELFAQMRKAHTERKQEVAGAGDFSITQAHKSPQASTPEVSSASAAQGTRPAEGVPKLERSVMEIARKVLDGQVRQPAEARQQVIAAIVDERYGAIVPPSQRPQLMAALEFTLAEDPKFTQEVDRMLILAARDLATG